MQTSTLKTGSATYACHCLKVTEEQIIEAAAEPYVNDVEDITQQTMAGSGCTACHCSLRDILSRCKRNMD